MRVGTFVCRWFIAEQHVLDRIVMSTRENGFFYGLRLPLTQCSISTANLASFLFLMEKRKKKFFFSFYFLLNIVWIFFPCVLLFKYLSNARNLLHIWVDNNSHTHTINPLRLHTPIILAWEYFLLLLCMGMGMETANWRVQVSLCAVRCCAFFRNFWRYSNVSTIHL